MLSPDAIIFFSALSILLGFLTMAIAGAQHGNPLEGLPKSIVGFIQFLDDDEQGLLAILVFVFCYLLIGVAITSGLYLVVHFPVLLIAVATIFGWVIYQQILKYKASK